jgi:hypothetical protein
MAEQMHTDEIEARLEEDETRLAADERRLAADEARLEAEEEEVRESRTVAWLGIGLIVVLAIYAFQFFAIPRVMLDGVDPFAAMKESLAACLANIGAFLVFGVVFTVICCVAAMVLIWIPIIGWIAMSGVATVILGAALFVAWRQVYAAGASATSTMPPPAPQVPPTQP